MTGNKSRQGNCCRASALASPPVAAHRREMGLDAALALLGHRSLGITDTYAELDQALAVEAARKLG